MHLFGRLIMWVCRKCLLLLPPKLCLLIISKFWKFFAMDSNCYFSKSLHIIVYHFSFSFFLYLFLCSSINFFICYSQKAILSIFKPLISIFMVALNCFCLLELLKVLLSSLPFKFLLGSELWFFDISQSRIMASIFNINKVLSEPTFSPGICLLLLFDLVFRSIAWILIVKFTEDLPLIDIGWINRFPGLLFLFIVLYYFFFPLFF